MEIDEILSKYKPVKDIKISDYVTFISNLLKYHVENQEKKFTVTDGLKGIGTGIAENGFDQIKGSTLVEIRYLMPSLPNIKYYLDQLSNIRIEDFTNLLIINIRKNSAVPNRMVSREIKSKFPALNVITWELNDVNKLANKHRKKSAEIASNLFSLRLENVINKDIGDWKNDREEKIALLKEAYQRGQFSAFLGAGVSSSAGMPDWNTLLNSLFVSFLTKELGNQTNINDNDIKQIVERLNYIDEPSALMAARYLRKGLSKQPTEIKEFTRVVTDNLYKLRDISKKINSDLINSIAHLCMPRRTGAKVRSVITYNFDDLLERQLHDKTIMHHSIYSDVDIYDPDELPVYHVHGFLPEDQNRYEGLDKSTLVFSEEGYHQIYSDAYHWSNLVQLANLRENNCLMIGLSLTDPNLRRLLDIAARNIESPKHFAFMKRMTIDSFGYSYDKDNKKVQHIDNIEGAEDFLNRHHKLNEEIMKELGVNILWYEEYEDIPETLNKLV